MVQDLYCFACSFQGQWPHTTLSLVFIFKGALCYKHETPKDVYLEVDRRGCQIIEPPWALSRKESNYRFMVRSLRCWSFLSLSSDST